MNSKNPSTRKFSGLKDILVRLGWLAGGCDPIHCI